ncbi:hypothetical protein ATANTOWER_029931 [Ataeniobius toweri]|uniref:Uncharacterized protein n=1 Tax=Ataeniobius toweri TaxID=208326 RepID=A0ABU7BYB0_9TELE|nr:hypothetical protein [Ataeniobius toweri]
MLHSFALFSGICPQLLNTHKPSSVAAADVNRYLATAFWCKSSSTDTVFKRGAQRKTEIQREIDTETEMTKAGEKLERESVTFLEILLNHDLVRNHGKDYVISIKFSGNN